MITGDRVLRILDIWGMSVKEIVAIQRNLKIGRLRGILNPQERRGDTPPS